MYFELNLSISLIRDNYVHNNQEKFPSDWKMIQIASDSAEIKDSLVEMCPSSISASDPNLFFCF